ncbi:hypothetical protein [Streptomyces sp. SAI-041]|uniref:hypothetical protein n=1 Tax=Streptomyces sp. SAI-041 TaxID=2940548 RepID=UPI002473FD45|nr:hypothetical protein [Streptomyces sp. SAI-041]MDH6547896.1 hypothetical protein [Streptomyces sp. SAI-041]
MDAIGRTRFLPTVDSAAPRATGEVAGGLDWWPYVLALGLPGGLVVAATVRGRGGQRRAGRHAAH